MKTFFLVFIILKFPGPLPFENPAYASDDSRFSVFAQGHYTFHLSALEVTYIKTSNPALFRQKQFVYSLKIVH